ncbi:chromosomal organization and DNA repair protein Mms21 [Purpureocillium lavendulum]|uniref:Chromosomal organization and DNA repair protein Mms21 n=1 Tax=Purpureocillium lavendulum TaxID=1247861 RepID=A0AB34FSY8_9HYPO|nr:chromosomal organization and DNA repair protein Mms21 [Purpureocillium lavendulum]
MPRLVNRGTAATAASSAPELPPYEPPSCPLNDAARSALGQLSNNRGTVPYESQIKESVRALGLGVGDLHGRLLAQQQRLDGLRERRRERGVSEKTAEEERLEEHLAAFEDEVDVVTRGSEEALRGLVDMRSELEDEAVILGELYTAAATSGAAIAAAAQQRRGAGLGPEDDGDADEEEDRKVEPVPSTLDTLRELRAEKLDEYTRLTPYQRYAQNNDYAGFKKLWHDAAAGEGGAPLPDASRWFRSNGEPVMDRPGANKRRTTAGGDEEDEDNDDIAVEREVLSLKCPLTLRDLEEPYSNNKCKHTFEKSAILDYLPRTGTVQCPQTGCSHMFSRAKFDQDFFLDELMLRRIRRARQAELDNDRAADDDEDDDDDDDEGDEPSMVVRGERHVRGRIPKPEPE